ncbi:hypothetical protein GALMADRAFT_147483 [Galerina marginata CBS 339.88]|uniref:Uncharacterized protein n=1 Tax=Galerina marginata (strain CBS 339.88) TaxID=685588 RepID=A0A067SJY3_GALM3|nr:hypothetical protein GALMADRAFT_147483 [Galerina marginata CBS 339.88]
MSTNSRKLKFSANGLEKEITLLLTFTPPAAGKPYEDVFPTCWKVITLKKGGPTGAQVEFTANTAFAAPQIDDGNLVTATSSALCGTGQKCSIVDDGVVTPAVPGDAGYLICTNATAAATDIAVGFSDATGGDVEPALVWENVAVKSRVRAQFTPFLEIYATDDYQETQMLRGAVESPLLWKKNLQTLNKQTTMSVSVDGITGEILIKDA